MGVGTDDYVLRTEHDRMRRVADDQHAKFMAQLLENQRLVEALMDAKQALDAEHRPEPDGRCCVVCGPQDGSWPCVSRLIADELDAAHPGRKGLPHADV